MDIINIVFYTVTALLMVIAWFFKDKLSTIESNNAALSSKLEAHEKDDQAQHIKMLEIRVDAQQTFITRQEFNDTIRLVYTKLESISEDIKDLLTTKADKK